MTDDSDILRLEAEGLEDEFWGGPSIMSASELREETTGKHVSMFSSSVILIRSAIHHSLFGLHSSFVIRHSDFPPG
jgi:hypothetical protein